MKSKDITIRGGHTLKYIGGALWEFVPAWENCPIYLTFNDNKTDIIALDADSIGMPLMVGCTVCDYKISGIHNVDGAYMVCMLPLHKEKANELEEGDTVYVTDSVAYNFRVFPIGHIEFTINEEYILMWNKENDHDCIVLSTKQNKSLLTGVPVEHLDGVLVFSDEKNAKKHLYDKIQDKIVELKNKQRSLYNN